MGDRAVRLLALVAVVVAIALNAGPAHATNDPLWDQQWGPRQIHAEEAWAAGATGAGIKVGIVDTGIDFTHPDLQNKVVASARFLTSPSSSCQAGDGAQDDDDHGTHVSGIVAATANNAEGITGVAPGAQLVVAKALDCQGGGTTTDIAGGIRWAVAQGAKVVNLSLGADTTVVEQALFGGGPSDLRAAIEDAWNAGAVPVLASGNSATGLPIVNGSNNYGQLHAIVVGATDQSGGLACYSSPLGNATWGVVAPGGGQTCSSNTDGIVSTVRVHPDHKYGKMSGTSMATPHVSAVAAMLFGQGHTRDEVVDLILHRADPFPSCSCAGRLNAAAAVGGGAPIATTPSTSPPQPAQQTPTPQQPGAQQPAPQQPAPQQPGPQQPGPQQPGLRPAPDQPQPLPAPQPQPQPSPQPVTPAPQPISPQPIAPAPVGLLPAPEQPPAIPLEPAPPFAASDAPTTTAPVPPTPNRANAAFSETTTTTSSPPTTTTTVATEPRHAAAPATSRAVYQNKSSGGSTAEAIAAVTLLLGSAATGLALTRRPPAPDLL